MVMSHRIFYIDLNLIVKHIIVKIATSLPKNDLARLLGVQRPPGAPEGAPVTP